MDIYTREKGIVTYTTISLYIGGGFFLNSIFDIWYVANSYPTKELVRFGLHFPPINYHLPLFYGYVGALGAGVFATVVSILYLQNFLPPIDELTVNDFIPPTLPMFLFFLSLLLGSQFLGGSSWSKIFLDTTVLFTSFLILFTHMRSFSLFDIIFTIYLPLSFSILSVGLAWANFVSEYETPTMSHFMFAILSFTLRTLYIILVSLFFVLTNVSEGEQGQSTIDDFLE